MSTTKTKKELVRMAWVTALRQQGDRQCIGMARLEHQVCAMELLSEVIGTEARGLQTYVRVGAIAGLKRNQALRVIALNDGDCRNRRKHTFSEIADAVERWFATDKAA